MAHLRNRARVLTALLALGMTIGCQSPLVTGTKAPKVMVNYGSMEVMSEADLGIKVDFRTLLGRGYSVQAVSNFAKVVAKVTGPNIVGELTAEVTAFDCPSGQATLNFTNLPEGPVDVVVNAIDTSGKILVWAKKTNVPITAGQTATIEMECQAANGKLDIIFKCPVLCGGSPLPSVTPSVAPSATPTPAPTMAPPSPTPTPLPSNSVPYTAQQPHYIDVDPAGNIWVTNSTSASTDVVTKFSPNGDVLANVKLAGVNPWSVRTDPFGNAWFGGTGNYLTKLAPNGELLARITAGTAAGIDHIATAPNGDVWAVKDQRLDKYSQSGAFLGSFPIPNGANDLTVDSAGNVWVARQAGGVWKFGPDGQSFGIFGTPNLQAMDVAVAPDGNVWYCTYSNHVKKLSPSGDLLGTFVVGTRQHRSIDVSPTGDVWVTGDVESKVFKLSPSGLVTEYPVPAAPFYLDVDASGYAWVTVNGQSKPIRVGP